MRQGFIDTFSSSLRQNGIALFLPIYYRGGTVAQDISSEDLVSGITEKGQTALLCKTREQAIEFLSNIITPNDVILIMGARDNTLSDFAQSLAKI